MTLTEIQIKICYLPAFGEKPSDELLLEFMGNLDFPFNKEPMWRQGKNEFKKDKSTTI